jgi:hypothetical protein
VFVLNVKDGSTVVPPVEVTGARDAILFQHHAETTERPGPHKVSSTGTLTYVAQSNEFASDNLRGRMPGGMPGGLCSGSSNGADPNSAILVCTIPYGDANTQVVNGRLLVYDPVHLAADGSLKVLWDSQRFAVTFVFNKFNPPLIDGGNIYVPNYNGGVDVYRTKR